AAKRTVTVEKNRQFRHDSPAARWWQTSPAGCRPRFHRELRSQARLPLLLCRSDEFVGKDSGEAALFILVVQHHDRDYAQVLFAGMALRNLTLQVLHKTIREAVKSALATGIFLVALAAVWANELDLVQLRIAVQSSPTGAAHPDRLGIVPFHRTP